MKYKKLKINNSRQLANSVTRFVPEPPILYYCVISCITMTKKRLILKLVYTQREERQMKMKVRFTLNDTVENQFIVMKKSCSARWSCPTLGDSKALANCVFVG